MSKTSNAGTKTKVSTSATSHKKSAQEFLIHQKHHDFDALVRTGKDEKAKFTVQARKEGVEHRIKFYNASSDKAVVFVKKTALQPVYTVFDGSSKERVTTLTREWTPFQKQYSIRLPNPGKLSGDVVRARGDLVNQKYEFLLNGKSIARVVPDEKGHYRLKVCSSCRVDANILLWCCLTIDETVPRGD